MNYRELGRTGWQISEVSFGAWGIGGDVWGPTDDRTSLRALHRAADAGVNFFDTADVYGDGHSEKLIAQLRGERREEIIVATKAGRRLNPHVASGYNRENLTAFVERSLKNLGADTIDLLQLHCSPSEVYETADVFGVLDDLVREGKVRHYGVSVERVDEAMRAIQYDGVQSVQIVLNMFRLKPADGFVAAAAEELRPLVPENASMAQLALRWILMFPEVTAAIPGAKNEPQVDDNVRATELPPLSPEAMAHVRTVYDIHFREPTHAQW
ncbi:MAG: aldo/keto reductase [bacterium]